MSKVGSAVISAGAGELPCTCCRGQCLHGGRFSMTLINLSQSAPDLRCHRGGLQVPRIRGTQRGMLTKFVVYSQPPIYLNTNATHRQHIRGWRSGLRIALLVL